MHGRVSSYYYRECSMAGVDMTPLKPPGHVLGIGGSGLVNAEWTANKKVAALGQRGEVATARILNQIARTPGGPTVLHHVTPDGSQADVDHMVISGNHVLLVDSKAWKPATYWTIGGTHRRSFSLIRHEIAEYVPTLDYIERSRRRVERTAHAAGITDIIVDGPFFAIWPSVDGKDMSVAMLNLGPHSRAFSGKKIERAVKGWAKFGSADRRLVRVFSGKLEK